MRLTSRLFSSVDWLLVLSVFVLVVLGLSAQYGITLAQESAALSIFTKQLVALLVGLLAALVLALSNYRQLQSYVRSLYVFGTALLLGVLFFGVTRRGTTGWFDVGIVDLQPVEFVKLILILTLASMLSRRTHHRIGWREVIITGIPVGVYAFLVMLQPDVGSAALMIGIWVFMLLMAGMDRKVMLVSVIGAVTLMMVSWLLLFQDFQKERVLTFLEPERDPLGVGYNVHQARIAIGSGRLWGKGLGFGSQSQLQYLPEAQTDFIFAAIAEEFGFIGVLLVLGAFFLFLRRQWLLLLRVRDDFSAFLIVGIASMIGIQMAVNIGMNLGLVPVTGLPLPFVSYGGSSLVSSFMAFGILVSISMRTQHGIAVDNPLDTDSLIA
ncbi:rod shape-determining protein RodA [Candidatus Uhrbacteria bacterium RIFCSPHIGHO2_02_FULL_53_13]|uniref:Rod shape-determining protein RodA n=2 Tax=Candidatus Uhriibacteriota TaxID=1752732 RepID=A0A1F7TXC6_9BACT|nr:MAG: rod shape-determining protein RodA [Candidatus Uhrbacteria bacterium RIFCSPHIGHO2_02_FULL_53_13]OGL89220.1 MAG: rod shape-determining protein RodA [Candidatus Uhrbacteria bacterium RIFCSPLOWO2_02_FULL_53_10]